MLKKLQLTWCYKLWFREQARVVFITRAFTVGEVKKFDSFFKGIFILYIYLSCYFSNNIK